MEVLQNSQKFRVVWHGRTELTEVPDGCKTRCTRTPGIVARGAQNPQKFRVRPTELTEVPGTGMKVLQNFQKFRVLWHGRTELTEVSGRYVPYRTQPW